MENRQSLCETCKDIECYSYSTNLDTECMDYQPQTNADRIRAMSDEELAEWRSNGQCPSPPYHGDYDCMSMSCTECWLGWLKIEVEEKQL